MGHDSGSHPECGQFTVHLVGYGKSVTGSFLGIVSEGPLQGLVGGTTGGTTSGQGTAAAVALC